MLRQSQKKQGPKLSFFSTDQRISAIKAQALPNQWGSLNPRPPSPAYALAINQCTTSSQTSETVIYQAPDLASRSHFGAITH